VEQTAQGSGGVTIPGCIHKTCRCGAYRHGLVVDLAQLGLLLDLMIDLMTLFQPKWFYDFMNRIQDRKEPT